MNRSSRPEVFLRKDVFKICSKFIGEHPCPSAISTKLQSIWTAASNVKHSIHSATALQKCVLFTLAEIISKAKNLILFSYFYTGVFSSCAYRSLYSARFFSSAVLLSSPLVKK